MRIHEDYQLKLRMRGIEVEFMKHQTALNAWLYQDGKFLRSFLWAEVRGAPVNPIEFNNWLKWLDGQK